MCGMAGRWGFGKEIRSDTMTLLRHRGPDDAGYARFLSRSGLLEFVQTRLAVVDTSSAGHQPMSTSDGRYTIVLNGEIYNFRTLRRQLGQFGEFRSQTDTEVVLQAYAHWGLETFEKLDGMFALAIWDRRDETLILARDALGIKPLYIAEISSRGVAFASELKALLGQPAIDRTIRTESVSEFLSFLWIPEPHTMFEHIDKLPPGHFAVYRFGRREALHQYFDLKVRYQRKRNMSETDAIHLVAETLGTSIRDQLVSDVPLGAFFSGGLDSTAIVAEMAKVSDRSVISETIGFHRRDQRYDIAPSDVMFARRALAQLPSNIDYHETFVEEASLDLLPEIVRILDDPIGDPAAISTLLIARAVRSRATVMLSGMGAEELWGGYARYWAALSAVDHWGKWPPPVQNAVRRMLTLLPSSRPGPLMGALRQAKKYVRTAGRDVAEAFMTFESYIDRQELDTALTPAWRGADPWAKHMSLFRLAQDLDPIDQFGYVDALTFLPSLNLAYTDRASMAASIEVRVPFLSNAMVDLAAQLPPTMRVRGRVGKYALKHAAELMGVPSDIVWRKKTGFGAPVRSWMSRQNHPLIRALLDPDTIQDRGILNPDYVARLRHQHASGQEDYGLQLYGCMVLEQWFRTYVDRTESVAENQSWGESVHGS